MRMKYTKIATSIDTEMYIQNELIPKILKIIEEGQLTYFDAAIVPYLLQEAIEMCTCKKTQTTQFMAEF